MADCQLILFLRRPVPEFIDTTMKLVRQRNYVSCNFLIPYLLAHHRHSTDAVPELHKTEQGIAAQRNLQIAMNSADKLSIDAFASMIAPLQQIECARATNATTTPDALEGFKFFYKDYWCLLAAIRINNLFSLTYQLFYLSSFTSILNNNCRI
jgi:hypothetical protein